MRVKYPEHILILLPKIVDHEADKSSHDVNVKGKFIDSDIIHELDFLKSQLASKMAKIWLCTILKIEQKYKYECSINIDEKKHEWFNIR